MATGKKKHGPNDLIVHVPKAWGLTPANIKKLKEALQPVAKATIAQFGGPSSVVTLVTFNGNGYDEDKK
jgi:hypothetical protein